MYDARGPAAAGGSSQNLLFGLLTILVIVAAFAGTFFLPDILGGSARSGPASAAAAPKDRLIARLQAEEPRLATIFTHLREADPAGYDRFSSQVSASATQSEIMTITQQWLAESFADADQLITKIDVRHINALTDLSMRGLTELARSGSPYCKVSTWEKYQNMPQAQMQAEFFKLGQSAQPGGKLYEFSLDALVISAQALSEARRSPKSYGPLTAADQMQLQGLVQTFIMSPEIMPLLMAQNDPAKARNIDICGVGTAALRTFRNLPDDLKGRMLSSANPSSLGPNPFAMR